MRVMNSLYIVLPKNCTPESICCTKEFTAVVASDSCSDVKQSYALNGVYAAEPVLLL